MIRALVVALAIVLVSSLPVFAQDEGPDELAPIEVVEESAPPLAPSNLPAGFDPSRYVSQGDRYNCGDFPSQATAQAVLRADPRDPNRLDA